MQCTKFDLGWALPRTTAEGAYSKSVKKVTNFFIKILKEQNAESAYSFQV